jgi:hypothetical protein
MLSAQEEVDAEIGDKHAYKCNGEIEIKFEVVVSVYNLAMKGQCIYYKCD